jgi:hypothetical protein
MVARSSLALGPGEGVLLTGGWVQEDREGRAYLLEALVKEVTRRCTDHHVVAVAHGSLEVGVSHGTTTQKCLHLRSSVRL